jgi:hypothetical protein
VRLKSRPRSFTTCLISLIAAVALVPSTEVAAAPKNSHLSARSSGVVRLPEHLAHYRFEVFAPRLRDAPEATNLGLASAEQAVVERWSPWLRAHASCQRGGASCPAGSFAIRPVPWLISASPLLVDALLPTDVTCPKCATNAHWSAVAVVPDTGQSVNVFDVLFKGHATALRDIGAQLREFTAYAWAYHPGTCLTLLGHDHSRAAPWRRISWWVSKLEQQRAVALTQVGLALGLNASIFNGRCGRTHFVFSYRSFEAGLGPSGRWLVDSFAWDTPTPDRFRVSVRVCPTSYGSTAETVKLPRFRGVVIPRWMAGQVSLYTDPSDRVELLAPNGWRCSAVYGADGGGGISVYPAGLTKGADAQGISLSANPACEFCRLSMACPYFAEARREWRQTYEGTCSGPPPRREIVRPVSTTLVEITDPPGVKGANLPSGGDYVAYGNAAFFSRATAAGAFGSYISTCTMPTGNADFCKAILRWVYLDYDY